MYGLKKERLKKMKKCPFGILASGVTIFPDFTFVFSFRTNEVRFNSVKDVLVSVKRFISQLTIGTQTVTRVDLILAGTI